MSAVDKFIVELREDTLPVMRQEMCQYFCYLTTKKSYEFIPILIKLLCNIETILTRFNIKF